MPTHESDVCIIGGGISAAMLAQRLAERSPGLSVTVVEAGNRLFDLENRMTYRRRMIENGEYGWSGDAIEDQVAEGIISRTMAVGGSALHWGGVTNRFSAEDLRLRSMYGLAVDWPLSWEEFEPFICEAERRLGVQGEPSPFPEDQPSKPHPMAPMELDYNLRQLKAWAAKSGIPFWGTPEAKNTVDYDGRSACKRCGTCSICPTGARYSPDFTYKQLLENPNFALHDRTLIRRLVPDTGGSMIAAVRGVHRDRPEEPVEYVARQFVMASGYCWTSHLLLLSASSRFPNGLANRSGLVGRYMTGHAFVTAQVETDLQLFPGLMSHSLVSRQFFRCPTDQPYVRHDLRMWDSTFGRQPRLQDDEGRFLFGDALLDDWRTRARRGTARLRAYYDVHPSRDSSLTLDPKRKNRFGDPLPKIEHRLDAQTLERQPAMQQHILDVFGRIAKADGGRMGTPQFSTYLDHPAGGCRMGDDAATSVCDSYGQTHDHENLFIVGAPTLPTGGCTNGTLTFVGLTLRSAERIADVVGSTI